jgi:hypothetical protein
MSKQSFKSPKGNLQWVYITGKGRPNLNGQDEFSAQVVVPADEAEEAIAEIEAFWEANKPKGAKAPKSLGFKEDDNGNVVFIFKTRPTMADGKAKVIRIFNAKAEQVKLPEDVSIGNGSRGRISGQIAIYDAGAAARGATLYLDAIQVSKLIQYKGADTGFEADDDGDFVENGEFLPDDEV